MTNVFAFPNPVKRDLGLCIGCTIFGRLMRLGVIPDEVCERCNDVWPGNRSGAARGPQASTRAGDDRTAGTVP